MKYNLQGFSQEVASELNIDGIDLYLLRWFVDFKDTNQMDTKIVDGEVYYWIYHKKSQRGYADFTSAKNCYI